MSPEHDAAKLFESSINSAVHTNGPLARLLQLWRTIPGECWNSEGHFPSHLTKEERRVAREELRAIPEFFYSKTKLPVITPSNVRRFIAAMAELAGQFILWTWCSGSSRVALVMLSPPFGRCVLFPVDLRFGWDLRLQEHQSLLLEVDNALKPKVTTMEFRCKYWSRAGNSRDPDKTKCLRQAEEPMHIFGGNHICHLHREGRGWLVENPDGSAIFTKSPLSVMEDLLYEPGKHPPKDDCCKKTSMCAFSPQPDGKRSLKRTKLKSDFALHHCIGNCRCRLGHLVLRGVDPAKHQTMTALAALYHHRFCVALCKDIERAFGQHLKALQHMDAAHLISHIYAVSIEEADQELEVPLSDKELLKQVDVASISIRA